jgi:hypothetical protein
MNRLPEGNAIVYCEGAFNTLNGKTAQGSRIDIGYFRLSILSMLAGMPVTYWMAKQTEFRSSFPWNGP